MLGAISAPLEQHRLALKLRPLLAGELYLAGKLVFPVYVWRDGLFQEVINAGEVPAKDKIRDLLRTQVRQVYMHPEVIKGVREQLDSALVRVTRSLSVGDPRENGGRALQLMALNLAGLYQNPHDDE